MWESVAKGLEISKKQGKLWQFCCRFRPKKGGHYGNFFRRPETVTGEQSSNPEPETVAAPPESMALHVPTPTTIWELDGNLHRRIGEFGYFDTILNFIRTCKSAVQLYAPIMTHELQNIMENYGAQFAHACIVKFTFVLHYHEALKRKNILVITPGKMITITDFERGSYCYIRFCQGRLVYKEMRCKCPVEPFNRAMASIESTMGLGARNNQRWRESPTLYRGFAGTPIKCSCTVREGDCDIRTVWKPADLAYFIFPKTCINLMMSGGNATEHIFKWWGEIKTTWVQERCHATEEEGKTECTHRVHSVKEEHNGIFTQYHYEYDQGWVRFALFAPSKGSNGLTMLVHVLEFALEERCWSPGSDTTSSTVFDLYA